MFGLILLGLIILFAIVAPLFGKRWLPLAARSWLPLGLVVGLVVGFYADGFSLTQRRVHFYVDADGKNIDETWVKIDRFFNFDEYPEGTPKDPNWGDWVFAYRFSTGTDPIKCCYPTGGGGAGCAWFPGPNCP